MRFTPENALILMTHLKANLTLSPIKSRAGTGMIMTPKYLHSSFASYSKSCTAAIPSRLFQSHEILSEECDLFRVRANEKYYAKRYKVMITLAGIALSITHFLFWERIDVRFWISVTAWVFSAYIWKKLQIVEESILLINGLGVQVTTINGFGSEDSNFMASESIQSAYIFESFDGWTTRNFFNINTKNGDNFIVFQNLKPSIDFLRRLYRHFHITNTNNPKKANDRN